jgi:hypothetical protein
LGSIPLSSQLRQAGDEGVPLVTQAGSGFAGEVLSAITNTIIKGGASRVGKKLPLSKR